MPAADSAYTLHDSPGACSLVTHCPLEEFGAAFEARRVDLAAREHHGAGYRRINAKGEVPALVTPDGVLTECAAIVEHRSGGSLTAADFHFKAFG